MCLPVAVPIVVLLTPEWIDGTERTGVMWKLLQHAAKACATFIMLVEDGDYLCQLELS